MSDPIDWRDAFLVFSALLKEPLEASVLALGSASSTTDSNVAHALASTSRAVRARAMASVVTRVVGELQAARLR